MTGVQTCALPIFYNGNDTYGGMLTDFDVPAYWNSNLTVPQFISPVLLPYNHSTANSKWNPNADTSASSTLWTRTPWNEWFSNYLLSPSSVVIHSGGAGYTVAPAMVFGTEWTANTSYVIGQQIFYNSNLYTVSVSGTSNSTPPEFTTGTQVCGTLLELTYAGTPMTGYSVLSSAGTVAQVIIDNNGSGYITIPAVTFVGGNGAGARASVLMDNSLVRSIKTTIKYDRYEY